MDFDSISITFQEISITLWILPTIQLGALVHGLRMVDAWCTHPICFSQRQVAAAVAPWRWRMCWRMRRRKLGRRRLRWEPAADTFQAISITFDRISNAFQAISITFDSISITFQMISFTFGIISISFQMSSITFDSISLLFNWFPLLLIDFD